MKIYDRNDNILENPDLTRGYLTLDKLLITHHEAVEAVAEQWHHEVTKVYPNGGKEVKKVVDVPAVPAKEAWDEFEDINRYTEYTADQLSSMARSRRNSLLTDCDWTQVLDSPVDAATREAYRTYRQALRDITEQPGFPETIEWPQLPAIIKAAPDPVDAAFDALMGGDDHA